MTVYKSYKSAIHEASKYHDDRDEASLCQRVKWLQKAVDGRRKIATAGYQTSPMAHYRRSDEAADSELKPVTEGEDRDEQKNHEQQITDLVNGIEKALQKLRKLRNRQ